MDSVLHILDLVDSAPDVHAPVRVCIKSSDVNGRTLIVVIAFEDLELLILLRGWTW